MKKKIVVVNNSKAADVPMIRPPIKNVKCELLRIIDGEHSLYPKTYVVDYNGIEVYLNRHEFNFFTKPTKKNNIMKKSETQLIQVRIHLKSGKKLTSWDAITKYGITRLSSYIHKLRSNGMDIETKMVYKNGSHYAEYKLKK